MSPNDPMVLVHGWSVDGRAWEEIADRLGVERDVLVPDLPGHHGAPLGWSPVDDRSFHQHAVESLVRWWHETGLGAAPVVAWAWGGQVVIDAIASGGIGPASVALVCGAAPFQSERIRNAVEDDWPGLAARLVSAMGATPLDTAVQARLVQLMTDADPVAVEAVQEVRWQPPDGFRLPAGSIAVLGAEDRLTPPGENGDLAARWGAEVHIIEGVGHVPFLEAEDAFVGILNRWLDITDRSRSADP